MSEVVWKPLLGFEGIYSVSNIGAIRSEERTIFKKTGSAHLKMKMMKSILGKDGYCRISLRRDNKTFTFLLHRLILSSFVRSPVGKEEGCHKDGNSFNNHLTNLKWGTHAENEAHKVSKGTSNRGSNHYLSKLKEVDVQEIKTLLREGLSQMKVAKVFKVDRRLINQIATGKTWKHVEI